MKRPTPRSARDLQAKAAEIRIIVLNVLQFYQDQYAAAKITPPGARWRELRFSFPRHIEDAFWDITVDELWDKLYHFIKVGVVKEYNTIFMPRYVLDRQALNDYDKKWVFPKIN